MNRPFNIPVLQIKAHAYAGQEGQQVRDGKRRYHENQSDVVGDSFFERQERTVCDDCLGPRAAVRTQQYRRRSERASPEDNGPAGGGISYKGGRGTNILTLVNAQRRVCISALAMVAEIEQ